MEIVWKGSPNFGYPDGTTGRNGEKPIAIVLHIMEGTLEGSASWFNDPQSGASSHYGIGKDGRIWQFVDETNAAWTNGQVNFPSWKLLKPNINPNLYTISIEHEGFPGEPWTEAMFQADVWLIHQILQRWQIPADRDHLIGHYEIDSINRPYCPGSGCPWDRLLAELRRLAEDEQATLRAQLAAAQETIASLRAQIAQQAATLLQVQADLTHALQEQTALTTQLTELQITSGRLEADLARSNAHLELLKAEKASLEEQVETLNARLAGLTTSLAEARANQSLAEARVRELAEANATLARELDEARRQAAPPADAWGLIFAGLRKLFGSK